MKEVLNNEGHEKEQFPFVIPGIGGGPPQYFTEKDLVELGRKINEKLVQLAKEK